MIFTNHKTAKWQYLGLYERLCNSMRYFHLDESRVEGSDCTLLSLNIFHVGSSCRRQIKIALSNDPIFNHYSLFISMSVGICSVILEMQNGEFSRLFFSYNKIMPFPNYSENGKGSLFQNTRLYTKKHGY